MTFQITLVLAILGIAVVLFVTEKIRVDVVALMVLISLAMTGLVTPSEALSGFSNLAVITVWAVFILSGGLFRTGIADIIGRQVLRLTGKNEVRLLVVIMLTTSLLSSFMNDIGVAALLLPVVINIARKTGIPPSKLLMPLAFAALLGGLNTLIGTPPNILVSEALREAGLPPFEFFDYTPVGVTLTISGIAFMALVGRHLLPSRDVAKSVREQNGSELVNVFDLQERLFLLSLPPDRMPPEPITLAESRIGSILDINVLGIVRTGETLLAPHPKTPLKPGDKFIVAGRTDRINEFGNRQELLVEESNLAIQTLASAGLEVAELAFPPNSPLLGQNLKQIDFRRRFGVLVLAIWRDGIPVRSNVDNLPLETGDILLVQGLRDHVENLRKDPEFLVSNIARTDAYKLDERLMTVRVPPESSLAGKSLAQSRLSEVFDLTVLGILRDGETFLMPSAEETLRADDYLLVKGRPENLVSNRWLEALKVDPLRTPSLSALESDDVGLVEALLSPYSQLAGKTLNELHFREKYGLNVLALWREGRIWRGNLRNVGLRIGDSLLLHGPRQMTRVLGRERDFIVLAEEAQEPPRIEKAPVAVIIMVAMLTTVILEVIPLALAALIGVTLMILTGCLTMDEAYGYIEWKAVFLIAGMLPLGIAMERSGAALFLAEAMVELIGGLGPLAVLAGLYILAALASQVMPNPAVAVLLAPIALNTAANIGVSPYPLMMAIALSASAAFLSPVGHSANVLIMGPGGYRFSDYLRVGAPLTLVTLLVTLLFLPIFWPF